MAVKVLLFIVAVISSCSAYPSQQPQIGILIQEEFIPGTCIGQYMIKTYQSFVEQGGGGAVPIFVNQPDEYYEQLIPRLNGVLLPGGGIPKVINSPFGKVAAKIKQMAMDMNDAGIHFPIWGTCQGFEDMATWPTGTDILGNCSGTMGVSLPVNFTADAKSSRLYGHMPPYLQGVMTTENVTPNYHDLCLTTKTYMAVEEINEFYTSLSTSVDANGVEFVSSFESKKYPFYGVQFHPEKVNFLHSKGIAINQSPEAILMGQYFGNFLVREAKRNHNTFLSFDEEGRFAINRYHTNFNQREFSEMYCLTQKDVPNFDW